jgi:drug/metabolite transporter (DMT)-like permease
MAHAAPFRTDAPRTAIALRLVAAAAATGLGFCVHAAAREGATTGQIVVLRSALSIPPLLIWAAMTAPWRDWLPARPRLHLGRGLLGGLGMCLNFYALSQLPVTHAQALAYLAPVLSVPVAVVLLGERASSRAVLAVILGFAGMCAMLLTSVVRPDWGAAQLSGMAAGIAFACVMAFVRVHVRAMTATETTISIALSFAVVVTGIGLVAVAVTGWTPMESRLWALLIGAGLLGAGTHVAATAAQARAPVSLLAPFDYAGLGFAVVLDVVLFAHLPGPWGWLGIGLITAAGLLSALGGRPTGLRMR